MSRIGTLLFGCALLGAVGAANSDTVYRCGTDGTGAPVFTDTPCPKGVIVWTESGQADAIRKEIEQTVEAYLSKLTAEKTAMRIERGQQELCEKHGVLHQRQTLQRQEMQARGPRLEDFSSPFMPAPPQYYFAEKSWCQMVAGRMQCWG